MSDIERIKRDNAQFISHPMAHPGAMKKTAPDIIARGEGTIGRIQHDPEFPEDAKELGKILKRTPWRVIGHPQDLEP